MMNNKRYIIVILLLVFVLTGCTSKKLNEMSIDEILSLGVTSNESLYNTNNIGYRYYLPRGFEIVEDRDNIQILKSNGIEYFLNVDLVSYYNKTEIEREYNNTEVYKYVPISYKNKSGFLEIIQNNDYFLIKLVYNYAIIESQVKENEINETIMNMGYILSSIKYNDSVINNKFGEDILELNETTYKIFGPSKEQKETKSYAYYLEQYNEYTGDINLKIEDPDVINQTEVNIWVYLKK